MANFFSGLLSGLLGNKGYGPPPTLRPDQTLSRRSQFLAVLNQWASTPAFQYLWYITFDIPTLLSENNLAAWGEQLTNQAWGLDSAIDTLNNLYKDSTNQSGCMFAQELELPGESTNIDYVGQFNRGFTYSPVIQHRQLPQRVRIQLFESNASFADAIVRPWVILGGHYGAVARPNNATIKTNLMAYELAKSGDYANDLIIRKTWLLTDCIPVSVDPISHKYAPTDDLTIRETWWAYTRYQVIQSTPTGDQIQQAHK